MQPVQRFARYVVEGFDFGRPALAAAAAAAAGGEELSYVEGMGFETTADFAAGT